MMIKSAKNKHFIKILAKKELCNFNIGRNNDPHVIRYVSSRPSNEAIRKITLIYKLKTMTRK